MPSVTKQSASILNRLIAELPEGLVIDTAWLAQRGVSSGLRAYYVKSGWLEQPVRGVYRRPRGALSWEQAVISLQTMLGEKPLVVGGRSALALEGFEHYLSAEVATVHLYSLETPPSWLQKLKLPQRFVFHNSRRLFRGEAATGAEGVSFEESETGATNGLQGTSLKTLSWGQWDWPLTIARPERAILELLDELPNRESFHHADMVMQGAANLSPKLLQALLEECLSVKVKRLFFFFADRHPHAWLRYLDKDTVDLGSGKRMLVRGGRLDPDYLITVPKELAGAS